MKLRALRRNKTKRFWTFERMRRHFQRWAKEIQDTPPIEWMMYPPKPVHVFNVGDLASRAGDDVQKVLDVSGNCAEFECIKAPASGWCAVGDREWNLTRRYQPVAAQ